MKLFFFFISILSSNAILAQDSYYRNPPVNYYQVYEPYINPDNLAWLDGYMERIGENRVTGTEKDQLINPIRKQIFTLRTIMGMNTSLLVYQCEIRNLGVLIQKSQGVFDKFINIKEYEGFLNEMLRIQLWIKKDLGLPLNSSAIEKCQ
ncbi:MAG: hypothetical protein QE271_09040 [Bacteriovoracaceae bacterium]|nr:hypothetical protein [Bacteriovoracaceae bacterium]